VVREEEGVKCVTLWKDKWRRVLSHCCTAESQPFKCSEAENDPSAQMPLLKVALSHIFLIKKGFTQKLIALSTNMIKIM